jgi:6-phosphogluconolactonase (cycloisomerase 2 family)
MRGLMNISRQGLAPGTVMWSVMLCLILCLIQSLSVSAATRFAYSANYFGSTLSTYHVDGETGMLRHYDLTPTVKGPTTVLLHPSGRFLYTISQATDIIDIYRVDPVTGELTETRESGVKSGVRSSFQLVASPNGKYLYLAGRFSRNLMVFRINQDTGALTLLKKNNFPTHGDRARYIAITPNGRFVYISNTFSNSLAAYAIDEKTESIRPVPGMPFGTGDAPEGLMVHPSGRFLYVPNWITGEISAYAINQQSGVLSPLAVQKIGKGHQWPYTGSIHPSGKYLYVANYGSGDVSGFLIDQARGTLLPMPGMPVKVGGNPDAVQLDAEGRHAYVPNYDTMDMTVFDVDANTGRLVNPRRMFTRPGVRWLAFYEGKAPVRPGVGSMIVTDAARKTISSYAVNGNDAEPVLLSRLKLADQPGPIAVHPRAGLVFMSNPEGKRIDIFRLSGDGKITRVANSKILPEGTPVGLRVNQRGSHLYVITRAPNEYQSYAIDTKSARLIAADMDRLPADSKPLRQLGSPTERLNFVLDGGGDRIFMYNYYDARGPVMHAMTRRGSPFATGKGASDMVLDPSGRFGLVVNADDATVSVYKMPGRWGPIKQVETSPVKVGKHPIAITVNPNGRDVYVVDDEGLQVHHLLLDTESGKLTVLKSLSINSDANAKLKKLIVDPSGHFAFLNYTGRPGLTRFDVDPASGQLEHPVRIMSDTMVSSMALTTRFQ